MINKTVLITGCCGFIGSHISEKFIELEYNVIGIDKSLKNYNVLKNKKMIFINDSFENIINYDVFENIDIIIHLAGYAGVRSSIEYPEKYITNNITNSVTLFSKCKNKIILFASSSSVYGDNPDVLKRPMNENEILEYTNSPYACSKLSLEYFAKLYSKINNNKIFGFRFFTVYGSRCREDMAPYIFIDKIMNDKEIVIFGNGTSFRDYTHVSDIVNGIILCVENVKKLTNFEIFNLCSSCPINILEFIKTIEKITSKKAKIKFTEKNDSDVLGTWGSYEKANKLINYKPKMNLENGLIETYNWIKNK